MIHYLANIASRSTQDTTQSLIPATPAPALFAEGSTVAEKDNYQQNEFDEQNLTPDQPNQIQPVKTSDINNEMETPLAEKSIAISYFSGHTERLSNLEAGSALQNNLLETEGNKFEQPSKKIIAVPEPVNLNENKPVFINKSGLNTLSVKKGREKQTVNKTDAKSTKPGKLDELKRFIIEQKQFIAPSIEETQKVNKLIPSKTGVERIIPNLSVNENTRVVQNKIKLATPKLVIGKITVEILPSIATVPPKIITKVVPPTSKPSQSRSNKLIFGLGQM